MNGSGNVAAYFVVLKDNIELLPSGSVEPPPKVGRTAYIDKDELYGAFKHKQPVVVWRCPAAVVNELFDMIRGGMFL